MYAEEVIQGLRLECFRRWARQLRPCWVTTIEVTRNGQGGGEFRGKSKKKRLTWIKGEVHRPVWRLLTVKVAKSDSVF